MTSRKYLFLAQGLASLLLIAFYIATVSFFSTHPLQTDLARFYLSCRFYLRGADIYTPVTFGEFSSLHPQPGDERTAGMPAPQNLNSPMHTLLLSPLASYSFPAAFRIWSIFSFSCGLAGAMLVAASTFRNQQPALLLGSSIIFFAYFPTFVNAYLGQFSLVFFLLIATVWIFSRDGKDHYAGIFLGLAISLKVFAGLFFVFFLLRRRWSLLSWTLGTALVFNSFGALTMGLDPFVSYLRILAHVPWHDASWNASFAGFFSRAFGQLFAAGLAFPSWVPRTLVLLSTIAFFALLVHLALRRSVDRSAERFDLVFCMTIVAMLLISPYGWIYYFTCLAIPLMVLWKVIGQTRRKSLYRWAVALAWLLSTVPTAFVRSEEAHATNAVLVYIWAGIYFYALIAFMLILVLMFRSMEASESPAVLSGGAAG